MSVDNYSRTSIHLREETKETLRELKSPGQSYDGKIRELIEEDPDQ